MRRCITCDGLLEDSMFTDGSPICTSCVSRLHSEFNVQYSVPERPTRKQAVVNLVLAVKSRAEADASMGVCTAEDAVYGGPMEAWTANWVDSEPWRSIWSIMEMAEEDSAISQSLRRRYG